MCSYLVPRRRLVTKCSYWLCDVFVQRFFFDFLHTLLFGFSLYSYMLFELAIKVKVWRGVTARYPVVVLAQCYVYNRIARFNIYPTWQFTGYSTYLCGILSSVRAKKWIMLWMRMNISKSIRMKCLKHTYNSHRHTHTHSNTSNTFTLLARILHSILQIAIVIGFRIVR